MLNRAIRTNFDVKRKKIESFIVMNISAKYDNWLILVERIK